MPRSPRPHVIASVRVEVIAPVYKGLNPKYSTGTQAYNRAKPVYFTSSTLALTRALFAEAGLTAPCSVCQSLSTNCLILVNGPPTQGTRVKMRPAGPQVQLNPTVVPTLSCPVEIRDVLVRPGFIILRWPLWLYDQRLRTVRDLRRSIDRQRRESESVEATFEPLGDRLEPYPFFVPQPPLDAVWAPPTGAALRAASEAAPAPAQRDHGGL